MAAAGDAGADGGTDDGGVLAASPGEEGRAGSGAGSPGVSGAGMAALGSGVVAPPCAKHALRAAESEVEAGPEPSGVLFGGLRSQQHPTGSL